MLLTGSSAGGIGALLHADALAAHWPAASVKASPESGLFYAGVRSLADFRRGAQTPPEHMGLHHMWRPFVPPACAAAWGSVLAPGACTHAHHLLRHVATPLFLRENQFDSAKLANCGLDVHSHMGEAELSYLKEWGGLVRSEMRAVSARPRNGAWSPSCLAHAGNLGFASSPRLALPGWRADDDGQLISLREVFRAWYFETANTSLPRAVVAECGELPCSNASEGQACPRLLARECGPACARARRKRRIRDGKSPDGPGRNVCDVSAAGGAVMRAMPRRKRRAVGWRTCSSRRDRLASWWRRGAAVLCSPTRRSNRWLTGLFDSGCRGKCDALLYSLICIL